ncbi:MAG: hypothetical protein DRH57_07680 [Candidatus Cloacimonadota bacterium]|nr:MAG: hypothetical protein DRH57_07680 [Candidatus Cloacimonadota bacterium]
MFKVDIQDLVVGCNIWILHVDEISITNKVFPEKYIYLGKFGEEQEEYFLFITVLGQEIEIHYEKNGYMPTDIYNVGRFIIASERSRVIQIVRNVAVRPLSDELMHHIPSRYIRLLEDIKPELLI